jgi:hypothetical protein
VKVSKYKNKKVTLGSTVLCYLSGYHGRNNTKKKRAEDDASVNGGFKLYVLSCKFFLKLHT